MDPNAQTPPGGANNSGSGADTTTALSDLVTQLTQLTQLMATQLAAQNPSPSVSSQPGRCQEFFFPLSHQKWAQMWCETCKINLFSLIKLFYYMQSDLMVSPNSMPTF